MTTLIFDTETTGLPKHPNAKREAQPRIIEWGGILVDASGAIVDELDILINPEVALEAIITKITGLTDEDLRGQPTFADRAEVLRPFFARADRIVAHNLPFDETMMRLDLDRAGIADWPWPKVKLCTVQEHAEEWGYRPKLTQLYQHYTGQQFPQKHRALDDVKALLTVCQKAGIV